MREAAVGRRGRGQRDDEQPPPCRYLESGQAEEQELFGPLQTAHPVIYQVLYCTHYLVSQAPQPTEGRAVWFILASLGLSRCLVNSVCVYSATCAFTIRARW